jgi:RNA polymerase sigma-70 factor (ECF subfamily)
VRPYRSVTLSFTFNSRARGGPLLEVLDPDVVLRADGGTLAATGSREVRGARAVAGLVLAIPGWAWSCTPR